MLMRSGSARLMTFPIGDWLIFRRRDLFCYFSIFKTISVTHPVLFYSFGHSLQCHLILQN